MNKYGLNLRPAKPKKQPPRPSIALGFNEDDDNDVEKEIAIQASKSKSLKEVRKPYILTWWLLLCCICLYRLWCNFPFVFFFFPFFKVEEQQRKALEEDPTIFDYDGVYDKMKEKVARPLIQDREERKVWLQFLQFS